MVKALGILSLPKAIADGLLILQTILDHNRRPTRRCEDAVSDDRPQGATVSPDELIALLQQYSSELLQSELERTRMNTACFVESMALGSVPEPLKTAYSPLKGSMDSPRRNYRGTSHTGTPSFSRRQR